MGVGGLMSYVEKNCPGGFVPVNMGRCAEQYRKKTGKDAILLVDLSNCIPNVYEKSLDSYLCGNQIKEFLAVFMRLLKRFDGVGIRCEFYVHGAPSRERMEDWLKSRDEKLILNQDIFALMASGRYEEAEAKCKGVRTNCLKSCLLTTLRAEKFTVRQMVNEAYDDILEYIADLGGCFGVLSNDSEFIIVEGIENHFSIKKLNFDTLETMSYVRTALAAHLRLHPKHLPLLATLSGNNILTNEMLRTFHLELLQNMRNFRELKQKSFLPRFHLLPKIARWITGCTGDDDWAQVARRMKSPQLASSIAKSVQSYRLQTPSNHDESNEIDEIGSIWEKTVRKTISLFRKNLLNEFVYSVVTRRAIYGDVSLQFSNNVDFPGYDILLKTLRRKFYGILLNDLPREDNNTTVEVVFMIPDRNWFQKSKPIYPDSHPGLLTLLCDPSCSVDEKWRLLCWAVSDKLSMQKVRDLPGQVQIPALALYYLCHEVEKSLQTWQVEALVAQAVMLMTMTVSELKSLQVKAQDDVAVHISSVYQKTVQQVEDVAQACGNPTAFLFHPGYVYYDGKLFHQIYMALKDGGTGADHCGEKNILTYKAVMNFLFPKI